jgi:hypothetical protein
MKDSSTGSRVINEVVLGEEVLAGLTENVRQFLLKTSVLRTMTGPLYDAVTGGEGSVSCPAGDTTTDYRMARDGWYRPVKLFRFPREACNECDLKELCLGGPNDRANNPVRLPPGSSRCTTTRKCCKERAPNKGWPSRRRRSGRSYVPEPRWSARFTRPTVT